MSNAIDVGYYTKRAEREAGERKDCNLVPRAVAAFCEGTRFVLIDVLYNSHGYQALYEFNTDDGTMCLAQD